MESGEISVITPEPKRPRPEDFGLTEERLVVLRAGLGKRPYLIAFGSILVAAFAITWASEPSRGSAGRFLGVFLTVTLGLTPAGMLAAVPVIKRLERHWRESQPDSAAWGQYERAASEYLFAYADWLKTQRSWWSSLRPSNFEAQVADNLRRRGYEVRLTGRSRDGGVDIWARAPGGVDIVVQCKAYQKPVGPAVVRELYGTLLHERAQEGWLVTLAGFSDAAKQFAEGKPLRLLDVDTLIRHSGLFGPSPAN